MVTLADGENASSFRYLGAVGGSFPGITDLSTPEPFIDSLIEK